jgi:3-hydroxyacyl-CoA dehydrogenase
VDEKLGIAGSGAIATGLAACATRTNGHVLWARSDASAQRATKAIAKACERLGEGFDPAHVTVTTDIAALGDATFVVEAITEDVALKRELLGRLDEVAADDAVIGTTTSSLSVRELAAASGRPERFVGLHVFNPVPGLPPGSIDTCMQLGAAHPMGPVALLDYIGLDVSVAIGDAIGADVPQRLRDLCAEGALGRKSGRGLYPPEFYAR